jgi:hypothetical protein
MLTIPLNLAILLMTFAPLFDQRTWRHVPNLFFGAILAPGRRTVCSILRIVGLKDDAHFVNYHRVLNRAVWNARLAARCLLRLLIERFAPDGPILLGIDDTIERRWGAKIKARGIYRDPVRSSQSHFVKTSGLRWLSVMVLVPIPWAGTWWALPFLTVLAPSKRYYEQNGKRHKKLTDRARQMVLQIRRWLPHRELILVADSAFAALDLLTALVAKNVSCITRLRLDAALYDPAPPRAPGQKGRPSKKGKRCPSLNSILQDMSTVWDCITIPWYGAGLRTIEVCTGTAIWYHAGSAPLPVRWVLIRDPQKRFEPQALLCTNRDHDPTYIIQSFMKRWQVEVTFQETRKHLGVETQRQWSDKAIERTTPCLLGLFSFVALVAACSDHTKWLQVENTAWYKKVRPTFSDTLAAVRRYLWSAQGFSMSHQNPDIKKLHPNLFNAIQHALCQAA